MPHSTHINVKEMDYSIAPGESFYHHCNNGWIASQTLPADRARWNRFSILDEKSKADLKAIYESLKDEPHLTNIVAEFYLSGLDADGIENARESPIQDLLDQAAALSSPQDVVRLLAALHKEEIATAFFSPEMLPDLKNSKWNALLLYQDGLGLPDRDYYFEETKKPQREAYVVFLSQLLVLSGEAEEKAKAAAQAVLDLETLIAEFSLTSVQLRDLQSMYNVKTVADYPSGTFDLYIEQMGFSLDEKFILHNLNYFEKVWNIIETTPLELTKSYLKCRILASYAPYLSKDYLHAEFAFTGKALTGSEEIKAPWKRVGEVVGARLDAVGKMYVEKHFTAESKKAARELVQFIVDAFEEKIRNNAWMSEPTKEKALLKLSTFRVKIGYPNKWKDYSALEGIVDRNQPY
ncbi:hypothetical protein HDU91_000853, partial [Kappamyces sp. JEL0680]